MNQSKFREKRRLSQFSQGEVRAVLTLVADACEQVGRSVFGADLYRRGFSRGLSADLIDAAMHFLVRFGFAVSTGKLRWVVRKPFTDQDVEEACELAPVAYSPLQANETPFDMLRRVRKGEQIAT